MSILKVKNGNTWIEIPAGGQGVPSGGTTGQFLRKSSSTDYATEWSDATGGVTSVNGMTGDVTVSTIAVQDNAPSGGELVWIDTDESGDNVTIPQVDDNNVSADDTWSSQKISNEISSASLAACPVLLWTNSNPTADFAAQTILLDLSDYSAVAVFTDYTSSTLEVCTIVRKDANDSAIWYFTNVLTAASVAIAQRTVKMTDTGVTFGSGYVKVITATTTGTQYDSRLIPMKIYGIKFA